MSEKKKTDRPNRQAVPYADRVHRKKQPISPEKKPWFRQPGESAQAYSAFMNFLMLSSDERTYPKCAEIVGKSASLMRQWGQQWKWRLRAAHYEEHYALLRLESLESKRDDMYVRHEALASQALAIVEAKFESFLAQIQEGAEKLEMKPDALQRLFDTAIKVHRMAIIGRMDSMAERAESEERLAEKFSQELADLMQAVVNDLHVDERRAQEVLAKHLLNNTGGSDLR